MERGDRQVVSAFYVEAGFAAGGVASLPESAAHHARVKRLARGDAVGLTDGRGALGAGRIARIARAALEIEVESTEQVPAPPAIELFAPVGDRDRMLWLAEKATELGITGWRPVTFARSRSVSPRGEGEAFAHKLRARMIAALEQSHGAFLPAFRPGISVVEAAGAEAQLPSRLLLDAGGGRLPASGAACAILLGPEGGMEPGERELLVRSGWMPTRLAANVLRFETAGIAAIAAVRATW